ncbi:hypothetical protein LPTSP4_21040 [Leptospira ryugenii]|uniref:Uncharacterized protein n=1 Tax=Leptospira ryugenii TaxID=1917863 RepID=A0A2P2E114_9LEPT|nr:hypothetical protein [Leptospira ryugenii]GBF50578.1 hypothetical protein LPTSP4_21040 [Leptospira ryugenii]
MIDISPDFALKSIGRFDDSLVRLSQFRERVLSLTNLYKELATSYLNSLGDDAKITGQEKTKLIDLLEKILTLVSMMRKLDFLPEQSLVSLEKEKGLFRVQIRYMEGNGWELSGSLDPEYKIRISDFKTWFNTILADKMRSFLTEVGNASLDKEISPAEKIEIGKSLDQIAIEIIEMIIYVERIMKFQ